MTTKAIAAFGGLVVLGLCSGLLAALCGVGGGIVLVPAFKAMGIGHKTAVASSLAVIIPTALVATVRNHRADLIDWWLVAGVAIGAVVAARRSSRARRHGSAPLPVEVFLLGCAGPAPPPS